MEIIQEIGSYAGLAAVLGLAVLSALYFSQARDVRRLREWAGRAPERAPQPQPQRVVAKPVPKPPAAIRPATPAATPATAPKPATAQAAAAGAAPAVATGPAAATPAAARAADAGQTREQAEKTATDGAGGTDENGAGGGGGGDEGQAGAPAQSTVDSRQSTGESPQSAPEADVEGTDGDGTEVEGTDVDGTEVEGTDVEGDYEGGDDGEDEDFEDTGDEPALSPPPPILPPPRPTVPIGASGRGPAPVRRSQTAIIPPYEKSRPGGPVPDRTGLFSTPLRAVLVVGGTLVAIAVIGFGALQLTGNDKGGAGATKKKGSAVATQPAKKPKKKRKAGINPASVSVAVLNGTTVPGLAAQIGDSIERQGFQLGTVTNFVDQQRAESVVLFAPGAEREAADVGKRLKIAQREPIDAESQGIAGDATVVVVAGADKTQ